MDMIWAILFANDVAIGEVAAIAFADKAVAGTRESNEVADGLGLVFGNIADMVAIMGEHLDGIWIVVIRRFCLQVACELTEVFAVITMI